MRIYTYMSSYAGNEIINDYFRKGLIYYTAESLDQDVKRKSSLGILFPYSHNLRIHLDLLFLLSDDFVIILSTQRRLVLIFRLFRLAVEAIIANFSDEILFL